MHVCIFSMWLFSSLVFQCLLNHVWAWLGTMTLRNMVKNAVAWAKNNGYVRTNEVHGADEYRVSTFEKFNHKELNRTRHSASAEVEVQDPL